MGTDIHPAIEVLEYPETLEWTLAAIPPNDRNYEFFGLVAGVRGDLDPWVQPRGLPPHMHWLTHDREPRLYAAGVVDGDHTASWFTLTEARTFVLPDDVRKDTRRLWQRWLSYMEFVAADYVVPPNSVRVVFNFDS